jgi:hypothetical protein
MQRIDASYLYGVGKALHEIREIKTYFLGDDDNATEKRYAIPPLRRVQLEMRQLLFASVFDFKISEAPGIKFLEQIDIAIAKCESRKDEEE